MVLRKLDLLERSREDVDAQLPHSFLGNGNVHLTTACLYPSLAKLAEEHAFRAADLKNGSGPIRPMIQQSQPMQDTDPGFEVAFPSLAFLNCRDSLMATIFLPIVKIPVQGGQGFVVRKVAGVHMAAPAAPKENGKSILVFERPAPRRTAAYWALRDIDGLR